MAKYKFYNVVIKSGEVIKEKIIINTSPQAIKKKFITSDVIKIDLIKLPSDYRNLYKKEILNFLEDYKVKKFKVILYSYSGENTKIASILSCSVRAIDSMIAISNWSKCFLIERKECTYEESCFFFFEQNAKTVITDF